MWPLFGVALGRLVLVAAARWDVLIPPRLDRDDILDKRRGLPKPRMSAITLFLRRCAGRRLDAFG